MRIPRALQCAGLAACIAGPALADFDDGLAAYDAGDYEAARTHWAGPAEAGDATAQTAMAGLYLSGYGVPRDDRAAAAWFRKAARQGHAIAQLNLGELHEKGRGVARDPAEAWIWYSRAARQGNAWARQRRDAVGLVLDKATLAAARRRLADRN